MAGILISTSVNLFTSNSTNKMILMYVSICMMVSAFYLSVISMNLETLHDLFITAPDEFFNSANDEFGDRNKAWHKIYDPHLERLSVYLIVAFIAALLSLYFLGVSA